MTTNLAYWHLKKQKKPGLIVKEHTEVKELNENGMHTLADGTTQNFDKIINIASPWAEQLLKQNNIQPEYNLDLVRGSHIVMDNPQTHGYLLEISNERRISFVLPCQGKTLVSTTEQRQTLNEDIKPSEQEIDYLINAYNHHF